MLFRDKVLGAALLMLLASASLADAAAAFDAPPKGTNCNRSCWKGSNLFNVKRSLFKLCKSKVTVVDSNETFKNSGKSGPAKYKVCNTFIYYRFGTWQELYNFQLCQSKQALYLNQVVNKGYKQILKAPPKYSRC